MQISILIFCVLGGYLLGSISTARAVTKVVSPGTKLEDVALPDANTGGTFTLNTGGATTASVILGPRIGGIIGILDILKGALPALIIRLVFTDHPYFLFVGTAVIVGHIWPLYYRFRGGGLSPALGVLLVLDPVGTLISVLVAFILGIFIIREISFTVMGGPWLFIIWIAVRTGNWLYIVFSVLINVILLIAVLPDIRIHLRAQKDGKTDLSTSMDSILMGRMMKKMMDKMGLSPYKKE
jgi:acyl phosphate:glycerol-3-phosphate acyltransferase